MRYEVRKTDKLGRVRLESNHVYSAAPELAPTEVVCALRAREVSIADADGALIVTHPRAYGSAPTSTTDPASQLALLARKPGARGNSRVRVALPDGLRAYMDGLGKDARAERIRLMRNVSADKGWSAMVSAAESALARTGRVDEAGMAMAALRSESALVDYDEPVDLGVHDKVFGKEAM